jgi:hypothetical protein
VLRVQTEISGSRKHYPRYRAYLAHCNKETGLQHVIMYADRVSFFYAHVSPLGFRLTGGIVML